ncbi:MAG TPA: hypothetical protein VF990_01165 [Candidatus Dormibacteraeota bacterium]
MFGFNYWAVLVAAVVAFAGSVIHEHYPWKLYAIHTGDALTKTLVIAVILGVWR